MSTLGIAETVLRQFHRSEDFEAVVVQDNARRGLLQSASMLLTCPLNCPSRECLRPSDWNEPFWRSFRIS